MRAARACLLALGLVLLGCGSDSLPKGATNFPSSNPPSPSTPSTTSDPIPSIVSISSVDASAGSPDITLTIMGSNFENQNFKHSSVAFWTTNANNLHDNGKMLLTTFVSESELTATIPAELLQRPVSVQIVVLNGDTMGMSDGFFGYPKSNSVTFTVSP
jgi:hypothetical protein